VNIRDAKMIAESVRRTIFVIIIVGKVYVEIVARIIYVNMVFRGLNVWRAFARLTGTIERFVIARGLLRGSRGENVEMMFVNMIY
jgi:hypothetical protein